MNNNQARWYATGGKENSGVTPETKEEENKVTKLKRRGERGTRSLRKGSFG